MTRSSDPFTPPTAEQLADHLDRHPPRIPSAWSVWGPLAAVAGLTLLGFVIGGAAAMMLPWLAIVGMFGFLAWRVRGARQLDADATRTQEMAMLRRFPDALRRSWRLLPKLTVNPLLHARTIAMMSHCLDQVHAYDAALVGYDYLLKHLPTEHPGAVQLQLQRALSALGAERLVDADDSLRRVRRALPTDADRHSPVVAGLRLAQLAQQVRTNHFDDAVEQSQGLLDDLRPLSVNAGYGHALLALCHHHRREQDPGARRAADLWWSRATMLLPASSLTGRFPELAPLAEAAQGPAPTGRNTP